MTSAFSWQNSVSLCPASFCTPRSNLPVTPSISRASLVAQLVKNPPAPGFDPWVEKIPWRRGMLPTPAFWPGEFQRLCSSTGSQRIRLNEWLALIYLPTPVFLRFPCGSAGKESTHNAEDLNSILGWEDSLEKGKATHSSILAWRIPPTGVTWCHKESDTTEWLSLSLRGSG